MTPESAVSAASEALAFCRKQGYQVTVAVVDRTGLLKALVRDRFARAHTVDVATNKVWTAASFKLAIAAFANETQAGKPMSGLRHHPRVLAAGGGMIIEGGGMLLGAIGVSGAPSCENSSQPRMGMARSATISPFSSTAFPVYAVCRVTPAAASAGVLPASSIRPARTRRRTVSSNRFVAISRFRFNPGAGITHVCINGCHALRKAQ